MPKKGENSKAVEARVRKEETKRSANEKQKAQAEDREWAAAGEGAKSKAQAKKQDQVSFVPQVLTLAAESVFPHTRLYADLNSYVGAWLSGR